jgi:hypothetical protein
MSTEPKQPLITFLPPQEEVFWSEHRVQFLLWRRQLGKSFLLGSKGLSRMMRRKNHSVFVVSASILMGQENIRKEVEVWNILLDAYRRAAEQAGQMLTSNADGLDIDAVAELFEASKLETRIHHDRSTYSRTRVVAPNPDTARGFSGDVFGDEIGFWPDFDGVFDAVEPIISRNPEWLMWLATTPPADDTHTVYDILNPGDRKFTPNPRGNWFHTPSEEAGEEGFPIHRVDAYDAEAAGLPMYHPKRKKEPVTIEKARALALNKIAFDRNYLLKFHASSSSAIPLHLLHAAAARGDGQGIGIDVTDTISAA